MNDPQPQHQAEVFALIQSCSAHLRNADDGELRHAFSSPEYGESGEPTPQQLEAVYDTATKLCNEGNFRFATALALHLVTYESADPRFAFLAGTCMQRLGIHAAGGRFFCLALVHGGDNPAALFRLGECLLALGDKANAEKALDAAFESARDVEGGYELQRHAQTLIETMNKAAAATLRQAS